MTWHQFNCFNESHFAEHSDCVLISPGPSFWGYSAQLLQHFTLKVMLFGKQVHQADSWLQEYLYAFQQSWPMNHVTAQKNQKKWEITLTTKTAEVRQWEREASTTLNRTSQTPAIRHTLQCLFFFYNKHINSRLVSQSLPQCGGDASTNTRSKIWPPTAPVIVA